ncbi:MAG: hypothetical protein JSS66_04775 [Armatimonadetes bacterium]|nr:hypothetical protein [Armatimonadota bacterium]
MKERKYNKGELEAELRDINDLKVVTIERFYAVCAREVDETILVLVIEGEGYVVPITSVEGTQISFHCNGFGRRAHIPDVYAAYMHLAQKVCRMTLAQTVIESKHGDVYYARAIWKDNEGKSFTQVLSVVDACILSSLSDVRLGIVNSLFEGLHPVDDWPYQYDIEEW